MSNVNPIASAEEGVSRPLQRRRSVLEQQVGLILTNIIFFKFSFK